MGQYRIPAAEYAEKLEKALCAVRKRSDLWYLFGVEGSPVTLLRGFTVEERLLLLIQDAKTEDRNSHIVVSGWEAKAVLLKPLQDHDLVDVLEWT